MLVCAEVRAARVSETDVRRLTIAALTASGESADRLVAELRAMGPEVLPPLLAMRREALSEPHVARKAANKDNQVASRFQADLAKIEALIDRVAGQRYAWASELFWYTDLDQAKTAAVTTGKPILSLRMLGNLTDEFSCANSRFFRTTLYANQEVSKLLRQRFVLHWKSVRPVPRVTIDFGDGRKLERTVPGNSAHYALAADGQPLDVLPGLYGPRQFLAWLNDVDQLHSQLGALSQEDRATRRHEFHVTRADQIARSWARDLQVVGPQQWVRVNTSVPKSQAHSNAAYEVSQLAAPKFSVESPILRQLADNPAQMTQLTTDDIWTKIAALPAHRAQIDTATVAIIRRENPDAFRAGAKAVTKRVVEDGLLQLVVSLERSIGVDSVRNEYTLHREIHTWFASGQVPGDVDALNERVYAELFLTPSSDPWLGLAPSDVYSALTRDGRTEATQ
jgi:hypothetical protein